MPIDKDEEGNMENHCMILVNISFCHCPVKECAYFKKGYQNCFYNMSGKCCSALAVVEAAGRQDKNMLAMGGDA